MAQTEIAALRIRVKPTDKWAFSSRTMPRETPTGVDGTRDAIEITHNGRIYDVHAMKDDFYLVMDMQTAEFVTLDFTEVD